MTAGRGDEGIKAVIRRAAEDRHFCTRLFTNREKALADMPLSPEERELLMSAPRATLEQMIEHARKKPWYYVGPLVKTLGATAATLAALGAFCLPTSLGATAEATRAVRAYSDLRAIVSLEEAYKMQFGAYATLEELRKLEDSQGFVDRLSAAEYGYRFEITIEGDSFVAVARHRDRPEEEPAFKVGPDGEVEELE